MHGERVTAALAAPLSHAPVTVSGFKPPQRSASGGSPGDLRDRDSASCTSETQIGPFSALQTLAFLLVGLPAGAWAGLVAQGRVMIAANPHAHHGLTSIPLAYILSSLTLVHPVVATILGLSTSSSTWPTSPTFP